MSINMRTISKTLLLILVASISPTTLAKSERGIFPNDIVYCTQDNLQDRSISIKEIKQILEKESPSYVRPNGAYLKYLGRIKNRHAAFNIVGSAFFHGTAQDESKRIFVFSSNWHYLGEYGDVADFPVSFCRNELLFPYNASYGYAMVFSNSRPPDQVQLNGVAYNFDDTKE